MMPQGMDKEKLWVAYLDGQLSTSEAVAFEATLSEVERAQVGSEVHLERVIGERLQEAPGCPEGLWQGLASQIAASEAVPRTSLLGQPRALVAALTALAAATVFAFSDFRQRTPVEPILALASDMPQFVNGSSTSGDWSAVQEFMRQRQVALVMNSFDANLDTAHHPFRLVGASELGCHGNSVMEIRFECCGKPVKVILAKNGTKASTIVREGRANGEVRYVREMGVYVVGVVSKHPVPDLTRLFESPRTRVAGLA